jgi:hypothetical protein
VSGYIVEIFTERFSIRGTARGSGRFSDRLNDREPFLRLFAVIVQPHGGKLAADQLRHDSCLVHKSSIVLVTEIAMTEEDPHDAKGEMVQKVPHKVLVYTDRFAVQGQLFLPEGAEIEHALSRSQDRFIRLSSVYVSSLDDHGLSPFNSYFALINQEKVTYLGLVG